MIFSIGKGKQILFRHKIIFFLWVCFPRKKNIFFVFTLLISYTLFELSCLGDMIDAFKEQKGKSKVNDLFMHSHYSPLGNINVARYLEEYLEKNDLMNSFSSN